MGEGDSREGEVAEEHLDDKDDCERQHLVGDLHVKFQEAAPCNAT